MLSMSDINVDKFFSIFANTGAHVAFLVPTPTGYGKSIMDATSPVRELLKNSNVHDYSVQKQGPENKVLINSFFVYGDKLQKTVASLYRPNTKKGDPRIWFSKLTHYCVPCNLLALIIVNSDIYVINLSDNDISNSLINKGFVYDIVSESVHNENAVAAELLGKIRNIHKKGFIPSVTRGDPGVGDTLEHELGILRNNSKLPDYQGIELKATRISKGGEIRAVTRSTLFTKVPDKGLSYREIVDLYGKVQIPRGMKEARKQLYETFRASRPNAYDLQLEVDANEEELKIIYSRPDLKKYVSSWYINNLKQILLTKHHETFWVKAKSEFINGKEYFRYDKVLHTRNPNVSLVVPLLETDKITVDLAAHYEKNGKWRDHGMLFKMLPQDLHLLLGEPIEYSFT